MNNIIYAICDEPYCLWESDIRTASASFLKSIDHEYFHYIAERSSVDLDDPEKGMRAATCMRLALFQGGETLFLLIGALLQAPRCPHAWIGQCSTAELREVIERINAGRPFLMQNNCVRNVSWLDISEVVLSHCPPNTPGLHSSMESFAKFWELLALNHTNQYSIDEYNSLKHGFRVAPGGFEIAMGVHPAGSVPPSQQEMKSLGSSKWGAAFRVIKKLDGDVKGSRSRHSIRTAVNWDAEAVAQSLRLVADSIRNVTSCLGLDNGLKERKFRLPEQKSFETASRRADLLSMSMPMTSAAARSTTKEQLMIEIKKTSAKRLVRALKDVVSIKTEG